MAVIQQELDDPILEVFSITRVETSPDLKESKVYFSLLDENKAQRVLDILNTMSKFIRLKLGQRLRLKILPQLKFIFDDSIRYSVHIYQRIEEIKKEQSHSYD